MLALLFPKELRNNIICFSQDNDHSRIHRITGTGMDLTFSLCHPASVQEPIPTRRIPAMWSRALCADTPQSCTHYSLRQPLNCPMRQTECFLKLCWNGVPSIFAFVGLSSQHQATISDRLVLQVVMWPFTLLWTRPHCQYVIKAGAQNARNVLGVSWAAQSRAGRAFCLVSRILMLSQVTVACGSASRQAHGHGGAPCSVEV